MKKLLLIVAGIFVAMLLIGGLWFMGSYNGLVNKSLAVDNSWSQVETQYQRRFDLVPNLVAATKGVLTQEQTVFKAIADARTHYAGAAKGSNDQVQAAGQYDSAISRLLVVMENYPQLKSVESVQRLTDELAGTENRVAVVRDRYNGQVQIYNGAIRRFPRNLIAGMFGFHERAFFKSNEGAQSAPTVDLSL